MESDSVSFKKVSSRHHTWIKEGEFDSVSSKKVSSRYHTWIEDVESDSVLSKKVFIRKTAACRRIAAQHALSY